MANDHRGRPVPAGTRDRQYYEEKRRVFGSSAPTSRSAAVQMSDISDNGKYAAAKDMGDTSTQLERAYDAYEGLFDSYE